MCVCVCVWCGINGNWLVYGVYNKQRAVTSLNFMDCLICRMEKLCISYQIRDDIYLNFIYINFFLETLRNVIHLNKNINLDRVKILTFCI